MAYTFEPSIQNEVFVPDQLIAGSGQIITDTVVLASGLQITRGTLIGQQTAGEYLAVAGAASIGNSTGGANAGAETISAVTVSAAAKLGRYRANLITGSTTAVSGTFALTDPSGDQLGVGTLGTAFVTPEISFTIGNSSIAAVNDGFNVTVEAVAGAGAGQYVLASGTATDGSEQAKNWVVLAEDTDTTSTGANGAAMCPVYLMGEFDAQYMAFGAGLTAQGVKQALRQAGSNLVIKTNAVINPIV